MKRFLLILCLLFCIININKVVAQPTINMVSLTDTTFYKVKMTAVVTNKGGWTVSGVGFIYDTLPMPNRVTTGVKWRQVSTNCTENVPFTYDPNTLYLYMTSGKTYYIRAFVRKTSGGNDTVFSNQMVVNIPMPNPPVCAVDSITNIKIDSATFKGIVSEKNDGNVFYSKGFVYSTTEPMPTLDNATKSHIAASFSNFPHRWTSNVANLLSGQQYKIRSYSIFRYINKNVNDTIYSDTTHFKTLSACGFVPTDVYIDSIKITTARLNFAPGHYTQLEWQVEYGFAGHTPGEGTIINIDNDTVELTGLVGGRSYSVFVRAYCDTNEVSEWSIIKTFTTMPYPCAPIGDIYVTDIKHSSAKIAWNPGAMSQSKWEVLFAKSTDNFPATGTIVNNTPLIPLVGLTPQTQYKVRIRALCGDLLGDWSDDYYFNTIINSIEDDITKNNEKVIIYPNPTDETINFKTEHPEEITKIEIYSALGKLIYSSNQLPQTYSLIDQSKGLFLIKIFTNSSVQIEKIILN
jgi:hypothetical protein